MANNETQVARSSQGQQRVARRSEFDPFGFSTAEFFSNPFAAVRRMHDQMDRMFADAFGQQRDRAAMGGVGMWTPPVEVAERDNELTVCAELPGLKPEEVKVEVTGEALVIEGERKQESEHNEEGRWHSERHYGRFYRTIPLPEGAKTEAAKADFKNGELRVTIPIDRPQPNRRQIPINATGEAQQRSSK